MEATTYLMEIKFKGNELKVKGNYNGETFKVETVEPLYENGEFAISSFEDLSNYILSTKFKKR